MRNFNPELNEILVLEEEIAKLQKSNSFEQVSKIQLKLVRLYKSKNEFEKAYKLFQEFHEINLKNYNSESEKKLEELNKKFEVEKNNLKISKLQNEVKLKNQDLNSFTNKLAEKNSFLNSVLTKLEENPTFELENFQAEISLEIGSKNEWFEFESQFQEIHKDFLERLKQLAPKLSNRQQQVCILIKISLSSKEIANFLNISVESVEQHRYKIRKKLMLKSEENLTSFLLSI